MASTKCLTGAHRSIPKSAYYCKPMGKVHTAPEREQHKAQKLREKIDQLIKRPVVYQPVLYPRTFARANPDKKAPSFRPTTAIEHLFHTEIQFSKRTYLNL